MDIKDKSFLEKLNKDKTQQVNIADGNSSLQRPQIKNLT